MSAESDSRELCLYCGEKLSRLRPFAVFGTEELYLFSCETCRAEHLVPQPSNDWLSHEYAAYYKRRVGNISHPKSVYFTWLVDLISKQIPLPERVVDLGAGEGFFAEELVKLFPSSRIDVVDQCGVPRVHMGLIKGDVHEYTGMIEEWIKEPPLTQCYDLVTALDVIEHLRKPTEFLRQISEVLLRPGGLLLLTTPNVASLSHTIFRRLWPHYKVEHITYPTPMALRTALQRCGLEVVFMRSLVKRLPLDYCLNILSNFGPPVTQAIGAAITRLTPAIAASMILTVPTGELVVFAKRRS